MKKVLNVGGHNRAIAMPPIYHGWQSLILDIDPRCNPDIIGDARQLTRLPPAEYDAVYCAHNLEHYYRHEVPQVLAGFRHLLKPQGFAHIAVPDMGALMQVVVQKELDIDDFLYQSDAGPITVRDVIYGYGIEIERSGKDFFAHKTGFTVKSLSAMLAQCGFTHVFLGTGPLEIDAYAFTQRPTEADREHLRLPAF